MTRSITNSLVGPFHPVVPHPSRRADAPNETRGNVEESQVMPDLRQIEEDILADRTVNGHGMEVLRPQLHAGGEIHRRPPDFLADPAESAKAAGLRYVSDTVPGIARIRTGKDLEPG
jgi:hypothetical protein